MSTDEQHFDATPRRELSEEEKKIINAQKNGGFTPKEVQEHRKKGRFLQKGVSIDISDGKQITRYVVAKVYGPKSNKPTGSVLMVPTITAPLSQIQKPGPVIQTAGGAK